MMEIKVINKIANGQWAVDYTVPASCGCCGKTDRKSIVIKQKTKPTEDEIRNQIENIRV